MEQTYLEVFPQYEAVKGFFSTKHGAARGYPYDRQDVFEENDLQNAVPVWPKQIHQDHIERIETLPSAPLQIPDTDGLITDVTGVLLTTIHADCLPVYFLDRKKNAIGLVHAGWRGTNAGIAPKAVQKLAESYGSDPADLQIYIGPGIGRCCFETGREVYDAFCRRWSFTDRFAVRAGEKYYLDLKGINRRQLEEAGVPAANIAVSEHCTCCEPERFCSYRREGGTYLRMGAGLCLR